MKLFIIGVVLSRDITAAVIIVNYGLHVCMSVCSYDIMKIIDLRDSHRIIAITFGIEKPEWWTDRGMNRQSTDILRQHSPRYA